MYLFIKIRLDILLKCHGSYTAMKTEPIMFENDILINHSPLNMGVLRGDL